MTGITMIGTILLGALLSCINISLTQSYVVNDRIPNNIDQGVLNVLLSKAADISPSYSANNDICVPVEAVKEVGCILSDGNTSFEGEYESICKRHQLCYACGFAHSVTERQCNKRSLTDMHHLCSGLTSSSPFTCTAQGFSKFTALQQYGYRSLSESPEYFLECRHRCVLKYLHAG